MEEELMENSSCEVISNPCNTLYIVDMQNDFIDGCLGSDAAKATVANVVREIKSGKYNHIILTRDTHDKYYLSSLEGHNLPVEHCLKETYGWQINKDVLDALQESKINFDIFNKYTFGNIHDNQFMIPRCPDTITFVGLDTDICVVSNALILRALYPDTPMYYVEDATAGTSEENKQAALAVMRSCQIYPKEN